MTHTYIRLTALVFLLGCADAHAPSGKVDIVPLIAKAIVDAIGRSR